MDLKHGFTLQTQINVFTGSTIPMLITLVGLKRFVFMLFG